MSRHAQSKMKQKAKRKDKARARRKQGQSRRELLLLKTHQELVDIVDRTKKSSLNSEDHDTLLAVVETLTYVTEELSKKRVAVSRLKQILFGPKTEKTKDVLARANSEKGDSDSSDNKNDGDGSGKDNSNKNSPADKSAKPKPKRPGHGRHAASEYTGAEKIAVPHECLNHKDPCPECKTGKVYTQKQPSRIVRITGIGPLTARVYALERLRCNLCGEVFTAKSPAEAGDDKFDASVLAMVALLRYGCGMPFYRLERLCGSMGIPLPASTQWGIVRKGIGPFETAWKEMVRQAAQANVFYIDDTKMGVLDLSRELKRMLKEGATERVGVGTTGIIAKFDNHEVALFLTGKKHAGENLQDVLAHRKEGLAPPIQMADALACNTAHNIATIIAKCLIHGRRNFVDVVSSFPDKVETVLKAIEKVYENDAFTKKHAMSDDERLRYHQQHSKDVMDELKVWMSEQFENREVEPNSPLGGAITYMNKHWEGLTMFLRVAGAPLDSNTVERALKRAIMHRKNSLFYKTERGARAGDIYMSLLYTAELNGKNPWDYLLAIAKHPDQVESAPSQWLPWTYENTLKALSA